MYRYRLLIGSLPYTTWSHQGRSHWSGWSGFNPTMHFSSIYYAYITNIIQVATTLLVSGLTMILRMYLVEDQFILKPRSKAACDVTQQINYTRPSPSVFANRVWMVGLDTAHAQYVYI